MVNSTKATKKFRWNLEIANKLTYFAGLKRRPRRVLAGRREVVGITLI